MGATLASYYGVLIQRGFKASILGRSKCDHCGRKLGIIELIPLFSSLFWAINPRGSRCCHKKIPLTYFWTEAYGAIFSAVAAIALYRLLPSVLPETTAVVFVLAVMTLLLVILLFSAVEDIWLLSIDIRVPIVAIVITSLLTFVLSGRIAGGSVTSNLDQTLLLSQLASGWIGAITVSVLIIFSRGKGLGSGDIYWFFFVGSSLGLVGLATTALLTIFSAAGVGIVFAIYKRRMRGEIIPLVPFIILSWLIAFTFQTELLATWQKLLYV